MFSFFCHRIFIFHEMRSSYFMELAKITQRLSSFAAAVVLVVVDFPICRSSRIKRQMILALRGSMPMWPIL